MYLEAQRLGIDPEEFLFAEKWSTIKQEDRTVEKEQEERKKIRKKLEKKQIGLKSEELKKRKIELTERWLLNTQGISHLDLKDEKQAARVIERGTLDFYQNNNKKRRRK